MRRRDLRSGTLLHAVVPLVAALALFASSCDDDDTGPPPPPPPPQGGAGGEAGTGGAMGGGDVGGQGGGAAADYVVEVCTGAPTADPGADVCAVNTGDGRLFIVGDVLTPGRVYEQGGVLVDTMGAISCVGCDCVNDAAGATEVICPEAVISPGLINSHDHFGWMNGEPWVATLAGVDPPCAGSIGTIGGAARAATLRSTSLVVARTRTSAFSASFVSCSAAPPGLSAQAI